MNSISPILLVCLLAAGCTTHAHRLAEARQLFHRGELDAATQALEKAESHWHRDKDCLKLDRAMIDLVSGRPKDAETRLREVRDQFDYLSQTELSESALSMLTDDKQRAYAGEDYEQVLIRVFLALANLMSDGEDAAAYSWQIEEKQAAIIEEGSSIVIAGESENPKLAYKQLAIGPYLEFVRQSGVVGAAVRRLAIRFATSSARSALATRARRRLHLHARRSRTI
jgi:hypothetical protein